MPNYSNFEEYLNILIFYMHYIAQAQLNHQSSFNNTHSPINSQSYKSPNTNQNYVVTNISSKRPTSPSFHTRTKIRLVSPQGHPNVSFLVPKQNNPPKQVPLKLYKNFNNISQIELGSTHKKTVNSQKMQSNSIKLNKCTQNPIKPISYLTSNISKQMNTPIYKGKDLKTAKVCRPISPVRILINNKTFDVGGYKLQVHTNPQLQKLQQKRMKKKQQLKEVANQDQKSQPIGNNLQQLDLVTQQQSNFESVQEYYDVNMKEIQQLQNQIEQNSQEIKELLQNSKISKASSKNYIEPPQSQLIQQPQTSTFHKHQNLQQIDDPRPNQTLNNQATKKEAVCSHQTLINQLDFTARRIESKNPYEITKNSKDQASVQTEPNQNSITVESNTTKTSSKFNHLSLAQNIQYSIKIMNSLILQSSRQKNILLVQKPINQLTNNSLSNDDQQGAKANQILAAKLNQSPSNQAQSIERQKLNQSIKASNLKDSQTKPNPIDKHSTDKQKFDIQVISSQEIIEKNTTSVSSHRPVSIHLPKAIGTLINKQKEHTDTKQVLAAASNATKGRKFNNKIYL